MSNPLLRPNEPRFQKPPVQDATGKNLFAEGEAPVSIPSEADPYAAGASDEARPFQPQYEAQQSPRAGLLLLLSSLGWIAAALGAISFTGLLASGWICPLLGIGPAAASWLLGHEDLKAIRMGAIDATAHPRTRLAMLLGLTALLACLALIGSMIYRQMNFLPELF